MKRRIIIALALILVGFLAIIVAFGLSGWNLSIPKTEQILHIYEVTEDFLDISISSTEADVILLPAKDGVCRVECYEKPKVTYAISVSDGTLTISAIDTRAWYDYVHLFSYPSPKITVYLPEEAYRSFTVNSTTGDVTVPNQFSFDTVDINVSTGDVLCQAPSVGSLRIKTSTGDVELKNLVASEAIQITCSTGDVEFERCDAAELIIKTDTGDVEGSLLSPKIFFAESDTGSVDVPRSVTGGTCTVSTSTGDIDISIP